MIRASIRALLETAGALLLALVVLGVADSAEHGKIGYISSARVFREYVGAADVQKQFQKDVEEWRQKAQDLKSEIDKLSEELKSQDLMLSGEARERKRSELDQKRLEYERFIADIWGPDGKAARREIELTKPLVNKIDKILEELAEENEFELILDIDETSIVYSKEGLDLTDRVVEELNKEIVPVIGPGEKAKLAVFGFKEMSPQAMEGKYGRQISDLLERALLRLGLFEAWEGNLGDALVQEGIDREDEVDEKRAVDVCRIAGDDVAVIGSVTKLGSTIEVEVKMLDVKGGDVLTTEQGKTTRSETQEDLLPLVGDLASRLAIAYKPQ